MIQLSTRKFPSRQFLFLLLLIGGAAVLLWGALTHNMAVFGPIVAVDINQHRVNTALPEPNGRFSIRQTFIPQHDGLREIELLLVRREHLETEGELIVSLLDDAGQLIVEQSFATDALTHNQVLMVRFEAVSDSAKRPFTLQVGGTPDNPISVWGYSLDTIAAGSVSLTAGALAPDVPATTAQDLRLITRYQLTWREVVRVLGETLAAQGGLFLLTLLFLPLPGVLVLMAGSRWWPRFDGLAWWGTAVALGTALWPLLWFWLSILGGHWTRSALWTVLIVGWLSVIGKQLSVIGRKPSAISNHPITPSPCHPFTLSPLHLVTLSLLLLGFTLRLLAVRDIAFPLWVDASRHALITAVMAQTGRIITDYTPYLPVDRFPYHFGFHTISTSLMMMTERPLPDLLLYLGQLLNALVPLTVYAGAWLMTRRRGVSTMAAFLAAIPFFFPAYYATWGRFTQLTGMILMPVLIGLTWQVVRGGRRWRGSWWLVGLLAAGLFLVHFRVFLIYLPFVPAVWVMSWGRNGRTLFAAGLFTVALIGLRAWQLAQQSPNLGAAVSYSIPGYNAFPTGYYEAGWERYFVWAAGGLLALVLVDNLRRRCWSTLPLILAAWVGLLFLLLIGEPLGLPETSLINLNSMYITLFLPLAIFLAVGAAQLVRKSKQLPLVLQAVLAVGVGVGGTAVFLFGSRQQISIINPQTVLAWPADLDGLAWADVHLPPNAKVAVNSWKWLGNTYAGSDGGAWIVQLTGRQSTTPPADYIYSRALFAEVNAFNETAVAQTDWSSAESSDWLRSQGVTHIFIGAKGGFFDPAAVAGNPAASLIYADDGVFIFEIGE
ncbi:MAG: hypothetical protein KC419_04325 [Anaerolineales bacterium]|nr:hypothetical protein [Anaerolineales bacterium]